MTGNDKQIEVLIQRHARSAPGAMVGGHLDADEMSAFAEGHLPGAARAQYVSHLAGCDQCRQIVSQLALSGGAVTRAEPAVEKTTRSFWRGVLGLFAMPGLRYAAFAAVVLIVGVVGFVALRRTQQPRTDLVASNVTPSPQSGSAITQNPTTTNGNQAAAPSPVKAASQPAASGEGTKLAEAKPADSLAKDALKDLPVAPVETAKKEAQPGSVATARPAYAPVPPAEAQPSTAVASAAGVFGGPRKGDSNEKMVTLDRERDAVQSTTRTEEENRASMSKVSPARRQSDQKQKGPSRNFEPNQQNIQNQTQAEGRTAAPKPTTGDDKTSSDEPASRSVGGHRFQKQGTAWVDQKYKASMSLRTVARGSDEFNDLDSDLRSIAQQIGGTVIVVWKGKAYLFR